MRRLWGLATACALFACADTLVVDPLRAALQLVPDELAPASVALRVTDGRSRIQAEPDGRELVVSSDLLDAERSVWLHEIAHLRLRGPRPTSLVARRLASALEEGVADYFAATLEGSARIGDSRIGIRDLARGPSISEESWASLGLSGFDSHHFGWGFAAELWRAKPSSRAFLLDLVTTLSSAALSEGESPRAMLSALVEACPERSRAPFKRAIVAWIPSELHAFNNEETP